MKTPKKNIFGISIAVLLLCTMLFKMGVTLITRCHICAESFSIEKNTEEGKDSKEESISKGDHKLLFYGRVAVNHEHAASIIHAKPVCRYKYIKVNNPPKTVATPPPNSQV